MSSPAILYVHDLRGSGVVVSAIALARRLGAERETILCAGYGDGLFQDVDPAPAKLVVLSHDPPSWPRAAAALRLRRLIRSSGSGLVMSIGNFGHVTVLTASLALRVRKLFWISNEIGRPVRGTKNFRRRTWQRILLTSADSVVLVGRVLAESPLFAKALATGRAVYIANGIDLAAARSQRLAPSPHPWLDDGGPPVVVAIGRIHRQKNLEGLIAAAAIARRTTPLRLVIIGSGPDAYRRRLDQLAVQAGIADAILFAGQTDNVFAWLARAAVFALPSHWEGSSIALLEALAVGTPVLASRQAGDATYALEQGRRGALVDANSPEDIARGLLLQISADRILPGDRAEAFDLHRTHDAYLELLRRL